MKTNTYRITTELCKSVNLMFLPKTQDESLWIQRQLELLGVNWVDGNGVRRLDESLKGGLVVIAGLLYYRSEEDQRDYHLCEMEQFRTGELFLTPELRHIMAEFAKLAARVDDLAVKVNDIHEAIAADKPIMKKPKV